jgi:hypothetical protein
VCFALYFSIIELMNIYKADNDFDFNSLELSHPVNTTGNSYFTSLSIKGKPIYVETPQVTTKQGFVKNAKKVICDLMFSSNCTDFIQWFESLESTCHKLVYEKSDKWFQNTLEFEDIENAFSPSLKTFKSGKYHLCRCNIGLDYNTSAPITKVYNENEILVSYEEVTDQSQLISILEVRGIKFTSRSFQLDFDLKQVMILKTDNDFDKCLIRKSANGGGIVGDKSDSVVGKIGLPLPKYNKNSKKENISVIDEPDGDDDGDGDDDDDDIKGDINPSVSEVTIADTKEAQVELVEMSPSKQNDVTKNEDKHQELINSENIEAEPEESREISNDSDAKIDDSVILETQEVESSQNNESNDNLIDKETSEYTTDTTDSTITTIENTIISPTIIDSQESESTSNTNKHADTPILTDEPSSLFDIGEPIEGLELVEPELIIPDDKDAMTIKNPNQVYHEIYKKAKTRARQLKQDAIKAIMEANSIKDAYMLDDIDDSDLSDFEDDDDSDDASDNDEGVDSSAVY